MQTFVAIRFLLIGACGAHRPIEGHGNPRMEMIYCQWNVEHDSVFALGSRFSFADLSAVCMKKFFIGARGLFFYCQKGTGLKKSTAEMCGVVQMQF